MKLDGELDALLARLVLGQQAQLVGWGARQARGWSPLIGGCHCTMYAREQTACRATASMCLVAVAGSRASQRYDWRAYQGAGRTSERIEDILNRMVKGAHETRTNAEHYELIVGRGETVSITKTCHLGT